ncbi:MAG: SO_0444 family Cu/Zn efflux transporter [Desulfobacterales bacterium]|nr:SO_0444 family Cu/Zn efflux transporter [Desulfobacterales bacterium]
MYEVILGILTHFWEILNESAIYILFGFLMAGIVKGFLPEDYVAKNLGKKGLASILKASLIGVPLPLCSCGVIPAAVGLKQQGASKGASTAFLISTPESGIDSIAITWALLDPIMTIMRPIAAFFTATVAGILVDLLPDEEHKEINTCSCKGTCNNTGNNLKIYPTIKIRLKSGIQYAFGDMLSDIGKWILIGIGIASLISYFVPTEFFIYYSKNEFVSLLSILIISIPLYICASASTPIAAALVFKGLSPGAALVFLLAGPATNAATITVIAKVWGKKATITYLMSIAVCSIFMGWIVNRIYDWTSINITSWVHQGAENANNPFEIIAAIVLIILIIKEGKLFKSFFKPN